MTKKLFSWLSILIVFGFALQSCVHDEIYSSSDPASQEYHSKSLWKEDEKYIKNVMKVYQENEQEIRKDHGIPLWEYAMTMEKFDESFVMIPVASNGIITEILEVPRYKNKIYFNYKAHEDKISFFKTLSSNHPKKVLPTSISNEASKIFCSTRQISVWNPDNENNPDGAGHWVTNTVVNCYDIEVIDNPDAGGGGGGYDYPPPFGGPGGDNPVDSTTMMLNPCEKAKSIYNNTAVKSRYEQLKGKVGNTNETGYGFKTVSNGNGGTTTQTNALDPDAADPDHMKVGIYATTFGYSHTHLNKSGTDMSVKIFSPADINTFLTILHNAMQNNVPLNTVFGGMVASDPDTGYNIYQIQYTGNGSDLPAEFNKQQLDALKAWYKGVAQEIVNQTGELTHSDLQTLLAATLDKMSIHNTILFKIEGNTVKKVDYNQNGTPTENPCSS